MNIEETDSETSREDSDRCIHNIGNIDNVGKIMEYNKHEIIKNTKNNINKSKPININVNAPNNNKISSKYYFDDSDHIDKYCQARSADFIFINKKLRKILYPSDPSKKDTKKKNSKNNIITK